MAEANLIFSLGAYSDAVSQTLQSLQKNRIIQRIWEQDYTVWKAKPDNIINRLGWLNAPADTLKQLSYIHAVLNPVITEGYKNTVLLGMGGSSLAAEVFKGIFGSRNGYPNLYILDTTHPATISSISRKLNPAETMFLVSSKSGTTMETVLLFHYFYNLTQKVLGKKAGRNFIILTDPGSPLEELAYRLSLRHVFLTDPAIGGRYSALSFSGIVPAVLQGVPVDKLLLNAKEEAAKLHHNQTDSDGCVLGAALGTLVQKGRNKLTFIFPPSWAPLGRWLEQLIAESTGKEGRGILPVCTEQLTTPAVYGKDRLFVIFSSKEKVNSPKVSAIIDAGHPVITIQLKNKFQLGAQMFLWSMVAAVTGHILGINPFDQPDVEASKILTRRIIDLYRVEKKLPQEKAILITKECDGYGCSMAATAGEALAEFLGAAEDNAYVCLQVYLNPTPEVNAALLEMRTAISKKYHLAVSICYGPGYLHSTGQLHKGDAGQGLFIQLTSNDLLDIEIPDRPGDSISTITFGALKSAQAIGDRQALLRMNRKIIRFHLKKNIPATIKAISASLPKS